VQKFDSSGQPLYLLGNFSRTVFLGTDRSGNVYVADASNRVQKFSSSGSLVAQWGSAGTGDGQFTNPTGIGVDSRGFVYVVDRGASNGHTRIQKFDPSGKFVSRWPYGGTPDLAGASFDRFDNIYMRGDGKTFKFTSDGVILSSWNCTDPTGISVDANGHVYVTSGWGHGDQRVHVYKIVGTDYSIPSLEAVSPPSVAKGGEFEVAVTVKDSLRTLNMFGIGFELNFSNTSYVDFVSADTTGCFLGGGILYVLSADDASGKVSVGMSRKAPESGVTGGGTLIKLKVSNRTFCAR